MGFCVIVIMRASNLQNARLRRIGRDQTLKSLRPMVSSMAILLSNGRDDDQTLRTLVSLRYSKRMIAND